MRRSQMGIKKPAIVASYPISMNNNWQAPGNSFLAGAGNAIFARLATNAEPKPADEAPQFVLNQLSFGGKVEGSTASLPVKRAVALLADRNGVIDLDLPISVSLNDPQFRLGRAARGQMDTARRT